MGLRRASNISSTLKFFGVCFKFFFSSFMIRTCSSRFTLGSNNLQIAVERLVVFEYFATPIGKAYFGRN